MHQSYFIYIFILAAQLSLGIFILYKNVRSNLNRSIGLLIFAIAFWVFCLLITNTTQDAAAALFWGRMTFIGPAFIPALFLCFSLIYPERKKSIGPFGILLIMSPAILLALFSPTALNVRSVKIYGWGTELFTGALYPLLFVYFLLYCSVAFYNLFKTHKTANPAEKNQIKYLFTGGLLSVALALTTNLVLVHVGFSQLTVLGPLATLIFSVFTVFAITKAGLMDISVIISRSLAEFMATAFYAVVYVASVWLYRSYISSSIDPLFVIWTLSYGIFLSQTYQFLRIKIQTSSDKLILHGKYDYYKELSRTSTEVARTLYLPDILKVLYKTFHEVIEIRNPRIFLPENISSRQSEIHHYLAYDKTTLLPQGEEIRTDDPLAVMLADQRKPLLSEKDPDRHLIIPCLFEDRLIGFFVLGKKLSEDPYTDKDIQLLEVLANQAAVSIENAVGTEELKKTQEQLRTYAGTLEAKVKERTVELQEKLAELKEFHDLAVDRELRMIEMEKQLKELKDMQGHGT